MWCAVLDQHAEEILRNEFQKQSKQLIQVSVSNYFKMSNNWQMRWTHLK